MKFVSQFLFFPLDLFYLTLDALRISLDGFVYFPIRSDRDQPCIHCKNQDCGYSPRPLPPGMRKYHNKWLGLRIQPCTRKEIGEDHISRYVCDQDGAFVKYASGWIRFLSILLLLFWIWVIRLILRFVF